MTRVLNPSGGYKARPTREQAVRFFGEIIWNMAGHDGSRAKPWLSPGHALSKVGGGHTILVKPGLCRGPILTAMATWTWSRPITGRWIMLNRMILA